jgi:hypothetical protein
MTSFVDRRVLLSSALVALSRWLARPAVADDPDSINFLLAMSEKIDLGALQPHFPGYPVYVGLGASLCSLGFSALNAAALIASVCSGASALGLALCARRLSGEVAARTVVLLYAVAWLPWLIQSGAHSESLGLALVIWAYVSLALGRPSLAAFFGGLVLGARASYWPLIGSLFVLVAYKERSRRAQAIAGFGLGAAVWAVPFFLIVDPGEFFRLGAIHLRGHFASWGGSVATRPNLIDRSLGLARAVFFDGFSPSLFSATVVALVIACAFVHARKRTEVRRALEIASIALVPYAAWIFVGQNVIDQPRHALPLVLGGLLLLACAIPSPKPIALLLAALALLTNVPLLLDRISTPPAAEQAADWIARTYPDGEARPIAVMAGRSARFFRRLPPHFVVRQRYSVSEAIVDLARFDRLPSVTILTSEVDLRSGGDWPMALPDHWHIETGPQFCRDARIDRQEPCLGLSMLTWTPR